ncbi:MAG: AI-2E family transporter [Anaerolineales bacterium]|nr:AI-2E family transporter [Anaerolineales bacterium]
MDKSPLTRILVILLICIAALFLAQMLWQLLSGYADLILLFVLGWLVSFVLNPLVVQLSRQPIPRVVRPGFEFAFGTARAQAVLAFRFSRGAAVIIVYLIVAVAIIIAIGLLVPPAIVQLSELARHLPEYMKEVPKASGWVQNEIAGLGIRLNLEQAIQSALGSLQTYAADAIKNALSILTSLLSFFANLFLVLIISFIIALDGPNIRNLIVVNLIPKQYHDEFRFFAESVDRTFGGFIRGQIVQAFIVGIGSAIAMTVLGLNFVLIASLFAGLFMLIPMVGPFLALIPPFLVCLIQTPELAIWLLLALFIYQFIIVNVLMPRVMSEAVGLHPLLVFAALLLSIKVAGFWGAFFGIPVAGVLWAMAVFFFRQWQTKHPADAPDEEL